MVELVVIALSDDLPTSSPVDRLLLSLGEGSASRSSIKDTNVRTEASAEWKEGNDERAWGWSDIKSAQQIPVVAVLFVTALVLTGRDVVLSGTVRTGGRRKGWSIWTADSPIMYHGASPAIAPCMAGPSNDRGRSAEEVTNLCTAVGRKRVVTYP